GAHSAEVVLSDETKLRVAGVAALDEDADLAILKVTHGISAEPLSLAAGDLPPVGSRVYAIGTPGGKFVNTLSDGLVSAHRPAGRIPVFPKLPTMIQMTAPISHGSSGGPLLGPDGRVVGVTTLAFTNYPRPQDINQNLNFAVPASHVAQLLRERKEDAP